MGSQAELEDVHTNKASFVPDFSGSYNIELTVYDESVAVTQNIKVDVLNPDDALNTPPVVWFRNPVTECEMGGPFPHYQVCSISALAGDADGDSLTHRWTFWNLDSPNDKKTAVSSGEFVTLRDIPSTTAGRWHVEVVVNDGQADSEPAVIELVIKTGANTAPIANAAVNISRVMLGSEAILDGSGSRDREGDRLDFAWSWLDRPTGSKAEIVNASSERASFTPDVPGLYLARLVVTDSKGLSSWTDTLASSVSIFAKAKNNPPFAALKARAPGQPLVVGNPLVIDPASDSPYYGSFYLRDPDQDTPLYMLASVVEAPEGSSLQNFVLDYVHRSTGLVVRRGLGRLDKEGRYGIELTVSDGIESTTTRYSYDAVTCENYPTLRLELVGHSSGLCANMRYFPYYRSIYPEDVNPDRTVNNYYTSVVQRRSYRLTATDRDYTIEDLKATSTDPDLQPWFEGLTDGQVIRKGESVDFTLVRPVLPDEEEKNKLINSMYTDPNPEVTQEVQRLRNEARARFQALDFTWSFRIPEKEGYIFRVGR